MTNKTEDRFYFGKTGQPERFGLEDACWEGYEPVGTKQKDGRTVPNCVPKDKNEQPEEFGSEAPRIKAMESQLSDWIKQRDLLVKDIKRNPNDERAQRHLTRVRQEINALVTQIDNAKRGASFSRPGQPDKFDASSLNRGNFAEASSSPMLGKLLSEKAMPDGGWRAVQVGSDTLVISFEDADLARDFGRRASTKGYSATSPVATTGRYWNVEVKNGK